MRTFEISLWVVASAWASWRLVGTHRRRLDAAFAAAAVGLAAVHATVEGVRVHMIPIYAVVAGLLVVSAWPKRSVGDRPPVRRWVRAARAVPVIAWLAFGAVLPSMFPVFAYEQPRGRYAIGTAVYELKDGPRHRDVVVQAWYPAASGITGTTAGITTHPALLEAAYASFTGLPKPLFDALRLIKTHAVIKAPIAPDTPRFPVVLFSHGPLGANRSQSIFQMEALASAGFVTIAIDHTGYASTTIFPDGHAVPPGPDAEWPVFVDDRSTAMLNAWVADVRFVLDRLEALDKQDAQGILTGRLDLTRVGYVGASFGGSVVVQALLDEPRLKAGIAEDGKPYFAVDTPTALHRPLMYMQSAAPYIKSTDAQLARWKLTGAQFRSAEQDHYSRQMQLFGRATRPIYNVYIRRTNHVTFSDLDLIIRLPDSELMNIRRAHQIINAYSIAFFDRYLRDDAVALVDGRTPSPYDEVTVASRNVTTDEWLAENTQ
jgi:predicted dienelactone hydrolase